MSAPTLFDYLGPAVRATDPDTSVVALESVRRKLPKQRTQVLTAIVQSDAGATAWEVVDRLGGTVQRNVVSRRLTDLRNAGCIEDTGERRVGPTRVAEIVYRATDTGRDTLRVLQRLADEGSL